MSGTDKALDQRRAYVTAFNSTMVKIWKEKIVQYKAIRTGALFGSVMAVSTNADGKFTNIRLQSSFLEYGLFVNYGTGSNTWIGNPGDIGRQNLRQKKPWFSPKHYRSVMNLREFYADNLGKQCADVIASTISGRTANIVR